MTDQLAFHVDLKGPISVYAQIENQVQFAIASGRLAEGDLLPAVREVAEALDVNPNTVTKAYRDLEIMGLVSTRRGVGFTVKPDARQKCRETIVDAVTTHLRDAVAECSATGMTEKQIQKIVQQTISKGFAPYER